MKKWLKAAGIRAARTMAQTAIALIGTSQFVFEVDWRKIVAAAIVAGVLSVLTCVAGLPELKEKAG